MRKYMINKSKNQKESRAHLFNLPDNQDVKIVYVTSACSIAVEKLSDLLPAPKNMVKCLRCLKYEKTRRDK